MKRNVDQGQRQIAIGIVSFVVVVSSLWTAVDRTSSLSAEFRGQQSLELLAISGVIPQLPQNGSFREQFEARLDNLRANEFPWPSAPARIEREKSTNQIHILEGKVTIPALYQRFGEELIEPLAENQYLLKSAIIINGGYLAIEGLTLSMDASRSSACRGQQCPIYIQVKKGFLSIRHCVVSSWNEGVPAEYHRQRMRPFILASGKDGECYLEIEKSELSYLGCAKQEVAPGVMVPPRGSWGLSFYLATRAKITNSEIHHNYMGLYCHDVRQALVYRCQIHDNVSYGIDVHDYSQGGLFGENHLWDNGNHGIILSRGCSDNIIGKNFVHDHTRRVRDWFAHGIMFHDRANGNLLWGNILWHNHDGIHLHASRDNVIVLNRILFDFNYGIRVRESSAGNLFLLNSVYDAAKSGIRVESSHHNVFLDCSSGVSGLSFREARENVFIDESLPDEIRRAEGNILIEHPDPLAYYASLGRE